MAKKGALAKDPPLRGQARKDAQAAAAAAQPSLPQGPAESKPPAPEGARAASKWTRTGVGTYKDQYGNVLKGQRVAPKKDLSMKGRGGQPAQPVQPAGPPNEPPPGQPFEQLTPEQQMGEIGDVSGNIGMRMGEFSGQFDPNTFQQQYQPQFNEAMDRARQSVMSQFEQRNSQAFAQERQDFETSMANRGIAPGGPQYNRELQALTDRQDRARQEAMNAAEQAAQSVQQQGYQQASATAMLPGEIWGQYQAPVLAQYSQAGTMSQMAQQQQYQKELAALENKYRLQQIKATPRGGGGGGGGLDPYQQYELAQTMSRYNQQPQQPNPWAQAAGSFAGSFGAGLASRYGSGQ